MSVIAFLQQFLTLTTLVGIVILSRFVSRTWQLVIGITLVILGLLAGVK